MRPASLLRGLPYYNPRAEHDACGTGFIASLNGPSHEVLRMGLGALACLAHRGALSADAATGDGAGVLTQLPRAFFVEEYRKMQVGRRVAPDHVGVGVFFFLRDEGAGVHARRAAEQALAEEAITSFVWRPVPIDPEALGVYARESCPKIEHLLATAPAWDGPEAFERRLYRARQRMEAAFTRGGTGGEPPYVASLSARTIVYKGLMVAPQLAAFYRDLRDPAFVTEAVIYHQRYSTNTRPAWSRAQPFRRLAHNGEINTLQGNVAWMRARQRDLRAPFWDSLGEALFPVIDPDTSDSGMLDNAAELLHLSGRDLRHAMMMLVPEAWEGNPELPPGHRALHRYHACLTEPWDGPAAFVFGDGRFFGAILDRSGLRPMRYALTRDGWVFAGSEAGAVPVDPAGVTKYGKLGPGEFLCVDLQEHRILESDEVKDDVCGRRPYGAWTERNLIRVEAATAVAVAPVPDRAQLRRMQRAFADTAEEIVSVLRPMVEHGKEGIGSMGDDTPHAVLSTKERPLFHYFKQRFAEVTNPPIDHLREGLVFSLRTLLGPRGNLLGEGPEQARLIELPTPILLDPELDALRRLGEGDATFAARTLDATFAVADGPDALAPALERLCGDAARSVQSGAGILVVSDRAVDGERVAIPALMAVGAVHQQLIRAGLRMRAGIVIESAQPRDVHHLAALLGFGADVVQPYLALEVREILAALGYRSLDEVVGRADLLRQVRTGSPTADRLDLRPLLCPRGGR